jgi:hypothetical protein
MRKPARRLRSKSKVKQALDREDRKLLEVWRQDPDNKVCCVPGCGKPATERHHTRGRTRKVQNVVRWWAGCCHHHHEEVKRNARWAMALIIFKGTDREMPLLASGRYWNSDIPLATTNPSSTPIQTTV